MAKLVSFNGHAAEVQTGHLTIVFVRTKLTVRDVRRYTFVGGRLWLPRHEFMEAREVAKQAFATNKVIRKSLEGQYALF